MEEAPSNEKSCQTDVAPGSDHPIKTPVYSTEPGDPPLLQTPMLTSKSGIQQIIECFRTGTAQLKHILLKEVDTIFECKLCRSLFRGLPNLIKHREMYCFTRMPEHDVLSGDGKKSVKDLLEAIYPYSNKEECVLTLEPIAGNQNAVYQYLSKDHSLASSSPSPNHSSTNSWRHNSSDNQDPDTVEIPLGEEDNRYIHDERENVDMVETTDAEESKVHQDSEEPEETTKEAGDLASYQCILCNRTYRVQGRLKRHMQTVHKVVSSSSIRNSKKMTNGKVTDNPNASPSSSSDSQSSKNPKENKDPKFTIGFDFKTCFCKLCRRTFSSKQNLEKHIELHTDNGTDFFVKFYCCPLCHYKTRRKRDVLRHLSDFHKKKSSYLSKISQSLEDYSIKKPADVVLSKDWSKDRDQQELKAHSKHASPYVTRKNLSKTHGALRNKTPKTGNKGHHKKEVKKVKPDSPKGSVTKKSVHVCDICGQSFTKTRYLGLHKRMHLTNASRSAGVRTRSKAML